MRLASFVLFGSFSTLLGCGLVRIESPDGKEAAASGTATVVPASIHYESGKLYADLFVERAERSHVTVTLDGPGAASAPKERHCSDVREVAPGRSLAHCSSVLDEQANMFRAAFLESGGVDLDPARATTGPYTLRVQLDGRQVAEHRFSLAKVVSVGNQPVWVVAPADRPNTLAFDGRRALAWVRLDGRANWGHHYMRFAWFKDGQLVHTDDAELEPRYLHKVALQAEVDLDAPVADSRPFKLELPKDLAGSWTVVALLDGTTAAGSWDLGVDASGLSTTTGKSFGSATYNAKLPAAFTVGRGDVSAPLLATAQKAHHVGPPSSPSDEVNVCVYAFEPKARPLLEKAAKLSRASWNALGNASASYQDEYAQLARKAAAQGRIAPDGKHVYVSQKELDDAGRRGDRRAAPSEAQRTQIEGEEKQAWVELKSLAKKYKPGCLREGLRAAGTTLPE